MTNLIPPRSMWVINLVEKGKVFHTFPWVGNRVFSHRGGKTLFPFAKKLLVKRGRDREWKAERVFTPFLLSSLLYYFLPLLPPPPAKKRTNNQGANALGFANAFTRVRSFLSSDKV